MLGSAGGYSRRMPGRQVPNPGKGSGSHSGCSSESTRMWVSKGILQFSKQILHDSEKWMTIGKLLPQENWGHWLWLTRARKKGRRRKMRGEGEGEVKESILLDHHQQEINPQ